MGSVWNSCWSEFERFHTTVITEHFSYLTQCHVITPITRLNSCQAESHQHNQTKGLVSKKELWFVCQWGSEAQKCGFVKSVDKVN